jgi:hypothetical protein
MTQTINKTHKNIISIYDSFLSLDKEERSKHIVYKYKDSAISYINKTSNKTIIGFHKGYLLENDFEFIKTDSKYIRHLYFTNFSDVDKQLLKDIINMSISLSIELKEANKLKQHLRRQYANTTSD